MVLIGQGTGCEKSFGSRSAASLCMNKTFLVCEYLGDMETKRDVLFSPSSGKKIEGRFNCSSQAIRLKGILMNL